MKDAEPFREAVEALELTRDALLAQLSEEVVKISTVRCGVGIV